MVHLVGFSAFQDQDHCREGNPRLPAAGRKSKRGTEKIWLLKVPWINQILSESPLLSLSQNYLSESTMDQSNFEIEMGDKPIVTLDVGGCVGFPADGGEKSSYSWPFTTDRNRVWYMPKRECGVCFLNSQFPRSVSWISIACEFMSSNGNHLVSGSVARIAGATSQTYWLISPCLFPSK